MYISVNITRCHHPKITKMNFIPFPQLTTERLVLRQIKESDHDIILFLRSDSTVNKFIERPEHRKTKNKDDALKFIKEITENLKTNTAIAWGITLKNNPQIVGTICLWNFSNKGTVAEVGYDLNPEFQRKGIMNEALKSVVDYGFNTLNLSKIEAFTHKENENSIKLLENNRFHWMEHRKDDDNSNNIILESVNRD